MNLAGLSNEAKGLALWAGVVAFGVLFHLLTHRRARFTLIHRRGGKLLSQKEAQAEAEKKGGAK